jgi:hypothetical protein
MMRARRFQAVGVVLAVALTLASAFDAGCGSSSGGSGPQDSSVGPESSPPEGGIEAASDATFDAGSEGSTAPDASHDAQGSDSGKEGGSYPPPTGPVAQPICAMGACLDFPSTPINATSGVPANASSLFGAPGNYGPPTAGTPLCVLEPQIGSGATPGEMIPANWVRPRFRVNASGLDLFEIRITSPWEQYPLVVYTTQPEWYMTKAIWSGTQDLDAGAPTGTGLGNNAAGAPLTVTIRGINTSVSGMTPVGVSGDFNIAPVAATGSIAFWTASSPTIAPTSSQLYGFTVGDEGVQPVLTLAQLAWAGQPGEDGAELRGYYTPVTGFTEGQVQCMGCHTRTPDGSALVFTDNWSWVKGAASVPSPTTAVGGAIPTGFSGAGSDAGGPTFGAGAQSIFRTPWWGTQSMSPAHWTSGDAILISSYGVSFQGEPPAFATGQMRTTPWEPLPYYDTSDPFLDDKVNYHQLAWINMESSATIDVAFPVNPDYGQTLTNRQMQAAAAEGTTWGLIATGDTSSDVSPAMSNLPATGTIAYVESDFTPDGHPDYTATQASIRTVPYNNHGGGTSTPLQGASDSGHLNYYPAYSPDDAFVAFVQAPTPSASSPDGPYYNRFGEVMVVPAGGGAAVSLAGDTPNVCAGDAVAAEVINSWPKWSPRVVSTASGGDPGKTYYFVLFTSARTYSDEFSQQFTLPADPTSDFNGVHLSSQLYLATLVVDNTTKAVTTYPAVYIWSQNRAPASGNTVENLQFSNLTPEWGPAALAPLAIAPAQ